ncbi:hypothetical protein [Paraburkholderia dilworthii]|uniref:hypothetical protein n=1 Tax=Paraburkholderia dilworthii TaxID=948106 RepID=UPI0003FBF92C|nr:hypothetical protein [Paraburkholderia dilworthii]
MRIDENRNLVLPVVTEKITRKVTKKVDGKDVTEEVTEDVVRIHAFHTPVSRAVFEQHYRVLAATKASLSSKGAHYLMGSGPRIAALTLKDEGRKEAISLGMIDERGNVNDDETDALFAEFKRLTTILCPGPNGWDMLPVETAISSGKIDAEDWEETVAAVTFFTCHYAMAKKADRATAANGTASFLGASITSSTPTEFLASLPTLTQDAPTTKTPSSIPS